MKCLVNGKAGEIPAVKVRTLADEFENAIRKFGVVAACEWFGHESDSLFTEETIDDLAEKANAENMRVLAADAPVTGIPAPVVSFDEEVPPNMLLNVEES